MRDAALGGGLGLIMGFVGLRSRAPELARIFAARWLAGLALRHASARERKPPKPLPGAQPPTQGLLYRQEGGSDLGGWGGLAVAREAGSGEVRRKTQPGTRGRFAGEEGRAGGLWAVLRTFGEEVGLEGDRKSTRLNSSH